MASRAVSASMQPTTQATSSIRPMDASVAANGSTRTSSGLSSAANKPA
jgi:hypothetical protein